jgi:hypothetical protein
MLELAAASAYVARASAAPGWSIEVHVVGASRSTAVPASCPSTVGKGEIPSGPPDEDLQRLAGRDLDHGLHSGSAPARIARISFHQREPSALRTARVDEDRSDARRHGPHLRRARKLEDNTFERRTMAG